MSRVPVASVWISEASPRQYSHEVLVGVADLGPNGYEAFLKGDLPQKATIRAVPRFLTSHPNYLWMNRVQCLNVGDVDLSTGLVRYDVYVT
jgi:hypothetical protein